MAGFLPKASIKVDAAHTDGIWALHWVQGNILTGSLDGTVVFREGNELKAQSTSAKQNVGVTSVVATSDGTTAVACFQDSVLRFYSLPSMQEIEIVDPGLLEAWTICLSPHDDVVVAGNHKGGLNIWSMQEGHEKVTTLETQNKFILSVAFSNDLKLASSGIDGYVNIFDINTQQIVHKKEAHALPTRCVAFSPDGNLIYTASDDRHVSVFDTVSGTVINTFSHAGLCFSVDASPDHRHFAVGCADQTVCLWDLGMQRNIHTFDQHSDQVWNVKFDETDSAGKRFASVGDDALLQTYE